MYVAFFQHNTTEYLGVITHQYVTQSPYVKFEKPKSLPCSDFVNPTVKRLEIHHFSHHKTASLSLDGDNLCFTYKVVFYLHKSAKEYSILVDQKESVSSRSIQKHRVSLAIPEGLAVSSEAYDYQEIEETAKICLATHFGDFDFHNVEVRHKVREN